MGERRGASTWDAVGTGAAPSWYLDPEVAAQKRTVHLELIERMRRMRPEPRRVLKTDLFEEAFGEDQLLGEFPVQARLLCGVDVAASTVARCQRRFPALGGKLAAGDLRALPFREASFDWIVSNSSLDHFETREELEAACGELCRLLRPGGVLLLTLDNPGNPLYHLLRFAARRGWAPFPLGVTMEAAEVKALLERQGLEVREQDYFLYNPRGVSTLLFLLIRKVLGRRGKGVVGALLRGFALLRKLPGWRWSACFHVTWGMRPERN